MPQSSLNTAQKPLAIMPAPDCPAVALSTTSTSRPCSRAVLAAKHPRGAAADHQQVAGDVSTFHSCFLLFFIGLTAPSWITLSIA